MENTLKEKSLQPAVAETIEKDNRTSPYSVLDERVKLALHCADEKKRHRYQRARSARDHQLYRIFYRGQRPQHAPGRHKVWRSLQYNSLLA